MSEMNEVKSPTPLTDAMESPSESPNLPSSLPRTSVTSVAPDLLSPTVTKDPTPTPTPVAPALLSPTVTKDHTPTPTPVAPALQLTTTSTPHQTSAPLSPHSAPSTPRDTLQDHMQVYLTKFKNIQEKERQLMSDLSCLHGEFQHKGNEKLFADAGYNDLRRFQRVESQLDKIIRRITTRQRQWSENSGSTQVKDLQNEIEVDKQDLDTHAAAYLQKKNELRGLRLKLEAMNPHPVWQIYEYNTNYQYQIIGNQTLPPNYPSPGSSIKTKTRKRKSNAVSEGAGSVVSSNRGTPEPLTAQSNITTRRRPRSRLAAQHRSTSQIQDHSYMKPETSNNPNTLAPIQHPERFVVQSLDNDAGFLTQTRPSKRPRMTQDMAVNSDIIHRYAIDFQVWNNQVQADRDAMKTHMRSINQHKSEIARLQFEIDGHSRSIAACERDYAAHERSLDEKMGFIASSMSEFSGSVQEMAALQRRMMEHSAAESEINFEQLQLSHEAQKVQLQALEKTCAEQKARLAEMDSRGAEINASAAESESQNGKVHETEVVYDASLSENAGVRQDGGSQHE